ncbi:EamA family transporter RarD [Acidihalobacter ferrooxydans]|nr:EamA family transporter RarD [Acidihalobacter ferrooxydans]
MPDSGNTRSGLLFGLTAYTLWGLFPLYFMLVDFASALEIVANRIIWSLLLCLLILATTRHLGDLRRILGNRRQLTYLLGAAALISVNWFGYVYAVNHNQVLQASLGYFINPLVTVLLAVIVLHERLRAIQWATIALALVGVLTIGIAYGHPPWISLMLAFSFGLYGLVKKFAGRQTGAVQSLAIETLLLAPVALLILLWLGSKGQTHFTSDGLTSMLLLASTGLATTAPLGSFAAAARRLPLSTLGMLQYLTPSMQFLIGVVVLHEPMSPLRWIGFALIWIALSLFSTDAIRAARRSRQDARREAERERLDKVSQEVH